MNQLWIRGQKITDKPDIIIFINGIPIVVIECKSPVAKNTGVIDAQTQLLRYQKEIPWLFSTNEILIGCNLFGAKYGTIEAPLEHYHRNALPNASFFAFTGTPLNKKDRNTYRHFSPPNEKYLDRYDMRDSEEDAATKPIKYQSRMANLQVVGNSIDTLLKELFPEKSQKELAEIKRRYATVGTLLTAPRRIERVAMDIVDHFNAKIAPNGFKAMIVACDRPTAVKYKESLDKLIGENRSTVVMTINNDDPQDWKENCSKKVEALIHAHIIDSGVMEILAPIHITAPEFKEKLQVKGSAKAKASHVGYAIREVINAKVAEDPQFYGSLKEQLETAIETDRKRRKDEADLLKDLVSINKQEERRDLVAKEKNLTPDEFAFYGLLELYVQSFAEDADAGKIALAKKLVESIKNRIVVDWTEKEDVQKEMRREIKNILREIKFPEDKREFFTREALELARVRLPY